MLADSLRNAGQGWSCHTPLGQVGDLCEVSQLYLLCWSIENKSVKGTGGLPYNECYRLDETLTADINRTVACMSRFGAAAALEVFE
jgi:hypothetical protein